VLKDLYRYNVVVVGRFISKYLFNCNCFYMYFILFSLFIHFG